MRIIIAAIIGGIISFGWGALSHMVLPTKDYGMKEMPNETMILPGMQQGIKERGLYIFPAAAMHQHDEGKPEATLPPGPGGLLLYDPNMEWSMGGKKLGIEFATNAVAALLLALVASLMTGSYGARAIALGLMGVFAWVSISASYWNWYGYPDRYTIAELVEQGGGWLLAGFVIAAICKYRVRAVVT